MRAPQLGAKVLLSEDFQVATADRSRYQRASALIDVWKAEEADTEEDARIISKWLTETPQGDAVQNWWPEPDELRRTARSFPESKAYSADGLHPRQVAALSDRLLWALINLFCRIVDDGLSATPLAAIIMKLIPKLTDEGLHKGEMAIGLFTTPVRVVMRCLRRNALASWMKANVPKNWFGVEGRASIQAARTRSTRAAYAAYRGWSSAACLVDVQKAYDHVRWSKLIVAARKYGFPDNLLRTLYWLHSGTRVVVVDSYVVDFVVPAISIVAGCTFADVLMFLIMRTVADEVAASAPKALTAVVADDFQVLACGPHFEGASLCARAANAAARAFSALALPLAKEKLVTLTSCAAAAKVLIFNAPFLRNTKASAARNVGADFTLSKKRSCKTAQA